MAWSPQARKAAALARKRRAKGRKPQYGVNRQGKKMTPAQRKKAGAKRVDPNKRNARIDRKIKKVKARTEKRVNKQGAKLGKNIYTDGTNVYTNKRGVKAHAKGQKIYAKGQKRVAKLKAKKRKRR